MKRPRLVKGLIQLYTGDSKGKTTAALGLTLRAVGHGFRVCIIQFLKGGAYTGELFAAQRLYPNITFLQYGISCQYSALIRQGEEQCRACGKCFPSEGKDNTDFKKLVRTGLAAAEEAICSDEYDIVILDEINQAVHLDFVSVNEVLELLDKKPPLVEVVLTGRNAHQALIQRADLVTEMKMHKHPFTKDIPSRRGIEY